MGRSFTNTTENDVLNNIFGTPTYTAHPSNLELLLSTTLTSEAGTVTGEVTGGSYARQAITFGAASGGVVSNSSTITFPVATAPWGKIVLWAVRDTVAGLVLAAGWFGAYFDTISASSTAADTMTVIGGTAPPVGQRVFFTQFDLEGANIVGVLGVPNSVDFFFDEYYVITSVTDTFSVSSTLGGPVLDIVTAISGNVQVWTSKMVTVNTGDQIVFAPGAITITLR